MVARAFVSADHTGTVRSAAEADTPSESMSRADLEAMAKARGVEDPGQYGNKAELVAAIEAQG